MIVMYCKLLDPRGSRSERDRRGQYFPHIKLFVAKLFLKITSNEKHFYFNLLLILFESWKRFYQFTIVPTKSFLY